MVKKTIAYTDFNGVQRKDDFFFHMSLPEVTRLQASVSPETFDEHILRIAKEGKEGAILQLLEKIILGAYGVKSPDGKSFIKTQEETRNFEYSQAYAELFEQLLLQPEEMRVFAEGIGALTKPVSKNTDWDDLMAAQKRTD